MEYDRKGRVVEKSNPFIHMNHVYSVSRVSFTFAANYLPQSAQPPLNLLKHAPLHPTSQFLDSASSLQFSWICYSSQNGELFNCYLPFLVIIRNLKKLKKNIFLSSYIL